MQKPNTQPKSIMDREEFNKIWESSGLEDAFNKVSNDPNAIEEQGMSEELAAHFRHISTLEDGEVIPYMESKGIF